MREIKFSIYGDQPSSLENPSGLLAEFTNRYKNAVYVERMSWEQAWPKLLDYSLRGGGPHVSQVGTIWTSSLRSMNVLRPFSSDEVTAVGGLNAFPTATWVNNMVAGEGQTWGIPFTGFTYLLLYRKDLLRKAGVDETTAFASAESLEITLQKLKTNGIRSTFVLPSGKPFRSRIHLTASWVWGANGNFLQENGKGVRFDEEKSLDGFSAFFQLYRHLSPSDHGLSYDECVQRFAAGSSAITIAGMLAYTEIARWNVPDVIDHLGVAPVPGIPWVGGSNLIIWKEAQMSPATEKSAFQLIQFLTSPEVQLQYSHAEKTIPANSEALSKMVFEIPAFGQAIRNSMARGRAYRQVPLWVRIVNGLRSELDEITIKVLENPKTETKKIVADHLEPLAKRFNLLLNY